MIILNEAEKYNVYRDNIVTGVKVGQGTTNEIERFVGLTKDTRLMKVPVKTAAKNDPQILMMITKSKIGRASRLGLNKSSGLYT